MTMKINRWIVLAALSAMVAACYGGDELPAPEDETGEAEAALTCEGGCYTQLRDCTRVCPPDDPSLPTNYCLDDCYAQYNACLDGC